MPGHNLLTTSLRALVVPLALILTLAPMTPASAQVVPPSGAITISPFLFETQLGPSDTSKDFQISLTNNTNKQQSFSVSAVDIGSQNDTGGLAFVDGNTRNFSLKYGLAKWLHLPADTLSLKAGDTTIVTASIANDDTLGPGGHYAAIIISVNNSAGTSGENVRVQQKLSALVFATKTGGEVYDMHLGQIQHDGNWRHLPEIFTLTFQNKGNVHAVPRGTLKLLSPGGKVVAQAPINEASAYVLPETSRQVVVQTHGINDAGLRRAGTYTITADYRYDGHPAFATKSITFTYRNIPGLIAAGVAITVVTGCSMYWWFRHHRRGKSITK